MENFEYSYIRNKKEQEDITIKGIKEKLNTLKTEISNKTTTRKTETWMTKSNNRSKENLQKIKKEVYHTVEESKKKANTERFLDLVESDEKERAYLKKYQKISYEQYSLMFPSLNEFWQWKLGDCYLISTIQSLARTKYFNTLMMTSIKVTNTGEYSISLPLWEPWGRIYNISKKELNISAVKWGTGFKLLEIAFAKYLLHKDPKKSITKDDIKKIEWGVPSEALQTLLWPQSVIVTKYRPHKGSSPFTLSGLPETKKKNIVKILEDFSLRKGNKYISLGSLPWGNDRKKYKIWSKTFYHKHAYSVIGVDKDTNGNISHIKVLNPRNNKGIDWWAEQLLTLSDFFSAFSVFDSGRITETFLNHSTNQQEIAVVDSKIRKNSKNLFSPPKSSNSSW